MGGADTVHVVVLTGHISAGVAALGLGPLAFLAARRGGGGGARLDHLYQVAVAALITTAIGLVALAPARLWWLLPIAVATEGAAVGGWWVWHRSGPATWAVRLLGGSYVSLITALLVVSWGTVLAWVAPAVLGLVLVESAASRAGLRFVIPHPRGAPTGTHTDPATASRPVTTVGQPGR